MVFIITQFITSLNRLLTDVCLSFFGIRFYVSVVGGVSVAIADASVSPCIDVRWAIYQYSNMAPRLLKQNCKFVDFLLSLNPKRDLYTKKTPPNI